MANKLLPCQCQKHTSGAIFYGLQEDYILASVWKLLFIIKVTIVVLIKLSYKFSSQ